MKNKKILISTLSLLILLNSCKEEFEYNQITKGLELIVVEGYITDIDSVHTIKLSTSSDFIDPHPPTPVNGAYVTVNDGNNTYLFSETEPGIYKNTQFFIGIAGKTYSLNVNYKNETYKAQSKLNPCMEIDAAYVIWDEEINYVLISGQEPQEPSQYYIIKHTVNGIQNDSLKNWGFFNDELINGLYLNYELLLMLEGKANDNISISMFSVSKEFFDYVISIAFNVGYEPDPFFSTTPANFKGNISNSGLGFFQAISVKNKECVRL